jgi:hypothetical protein
VEYLVVYYGAEVNCKDNCGKTVLQSAVDSKSVDIIECLVGNGADVKCEKNEHDWTIYSTSNNLTHNSNNTQDKSTTDVYGLGIDILKIAVSKGSVYLVELLLNKGIDVRKAREIRVEVLGREMSLLEWSIHHGYYDIGDILKPELQKSVRHREKIQMLKTMKCNQLNEVINTSYLMIHEYSPLLTGLINA